MDILTEDTVCRIRKDREISENDSIEGILWQTERRVRTMISIAERFMQDEEQSPCKNDEGFRIKFSMASDVIELICEYVDDRMDVIAALRKQMNDNFISVSLNDLYRQKRASGKSDVWTSSTAPEGP